MKNALKEFPEQKTLLRIFPEIELLQVNAHIHTPYSFSAFNDIEEIFEMAASENISVVGINDFFVTDGYESFYNESLKAGVFPLFNIEFISLQKKEQQEGIRINDPDNPGRCYISGKGLNYPSSLDDRLNKKINRIIAKNQDQLRIMIDKVNDCFARIGADINLSYAEVKKKFAKSLVRERHIARAIRTSVFERYPEDAEQIQLFTSLFGGTAPNSPLTEIHGLENEIRTNLLKAGGKAFVKENDNTFMNPDEVIEIIIGAGGIPCYPMLLDGKNGNFTEYENDPRQLWLELEKRKIGCIELIPGRNEACHVERFVRFFNNKGFVILFGTEHNTPELIPLTCYTRGKKPLSPEIRCISYEGCCVVAAHQYLHAKGKEGFIDRHGAPKTDTRDLFIKTGNAVIHYYVKSSKNNR